MAYSTRKKLCISASAPSLTMALVIRSRSRLSKSSEIHRSAAATFPMSSSVKDSSDSKKENIFRCDGAPCVPKASLSMASCLPGKYILQYHITPSKL